jgi:hypothetical protein
MPESLNVVLSVRSFGAALMQASKMASIKERPRFVDVIDGSGSWFGDVLRA